MKKLTKVDKIVIFSSLACGIVTLIPTLIFNWPFAIVLGAMLLSTFIAQWYIKLTFSDYKIKVSFQSGVKGPQIIFSLIGDESSLVWITIKNINGPIYLDRIEEVLLKQNLTFFDGYLIDNNHMIQANKFLQGYQLLVQYKERITNLVNIYPINDNSKKRKSFLFWR